MKLSNTLKDYQNKSSALAFCTNLHFLVFYKRVSRSCAQRRSSAASKRGLASLAGQEVNVGEENGILGTFAALYCPIFRAPSFRKSLEFFETSIASLDPEIVELPAFCILSAMFTGACGPPERLSLALVPRSYVLRMIVKLAYSLCFNRRAK